MIEWKYVYFEGMQYPVTLRPTDVQNKCLYIMFITKLAIAVE